MTTLTDIHARVAQELDLAHLPQDEQEAVVAEIGGMLYRRMLLAVYEKIPAEAHEQLGTLINTGDEAAITEFISTHVPDPEMVITQELETAIREYREATAAKTPS